MSNEQKEEEYDEEYELLREEIEAERKELRRLYWIKVCHLLAALGCLYFLVQSLFCAYFGDYNKAVYYVVMALLLKFDVFIEKRGKQ